jgi:hypothetical protein
VVDGLIDCSVSTNPTTVAWGFNVSANLTRCTFGFDHNLTASTYVCATQNGSLAVGGTGVASGSHTTITTGFPTFVSGTVVVTGLANLMIMVSRSAATLSINSGSYLRVQEL